MGEYAGREVTHAGASVGHSSSHAAPPSPAEQARHAVSAVTWRVSQVRHAGDQLDAAYRANNVARWHEAKHAFDATLAQARRALEQTTGKIAAAAEDTRAALDAATAALATESGRARDAEAPTGYTAIAHEDALLAVLRREAPDLDSLAGALHPVLDQLEIADLRILRSRIASPQPRDTLAAEIWKLGPRRRDRVRDLVHEVDRHKAHERAAAVRAANAAPAPAPAPESLDARLERAIAAPPAEVERTLAAALDGVGGDARRALADRLTRYRPGNGDTFAARFARLDAELRARILELLHTEPPRDAVHAIGVGMLEAPASMLMVPPSATAEPALHQCHPAPTATIDAEVEASLGPSDRPKQATPELDRFNAAVAEVGPRYHGIAPKAAAPADHAIAATYLQRNAIAAWDDLRAYLAEVSWPDLSPGLGWQSEARFAEQLAVALRRSLPWLTGSVVMNVLYPHDLFAIVDALRPAHGHLAWVPAIGLAFGQLVQRVAVTSLARLGPRVVDAADSDGDIDASRVAISHPMDGFVLAALRKPGVILVTGGKDATRPGPAPTRTIHLTWQGAADRDAWNWVRAEPADATPEEVIAQLAREPGGNESWFADALAVAPPLFGIPAGWARSIPAAAAHMPRTLGPEAFDLRTDTPEARLVELAHHAIANDAAALEAAPATAHPAPVSAATLGVLLDDCGIQLSTFQRDLGPWRLDELIVPALARVERKRAELGFATAHDLEVQSAIAAGQKRRLTLIAKELVRIEAELAKHDRPDRTSTGLAPLRAVVRKLGGAAAASHVAAASDALFADAMRAEADLSVDRVQAQILDLAAATGIPTAARRGREADDRPTARRLALEGERALAQARVVEDELLDGRTVGAADLDQATLSAQETALRSRLDGLFVQSGQLQVAADEAGSGAAGEIASLFSSKFRTLQDVTRDIRLHVDRVTSDWWTALHPSGSIPLDGSGAPAVSDLAVRHTALDAATRSFDKIRNDDALMKVIADGQALIHSQQLRKVFVSIGAMIVVAIVAQNAAGIVAEEVGAAFLSMEEAGTIGELSTTARAVTGASKIAVEVTGNAVGQAAINGSSVGDALFDNLVFAAGGQLIARTLGAELGTAREAAHAIEQEAVAAGAIEQRLAGLGSAGLQTLGWVAVKASQITGETITNVALANLAATLRGHASAPPEQALDWFVQALSVAVGRAVHGALGERMPGLERLAKRTDATAAERRLLADARELDELALVLARSRVARAEDSLAVLSERTRLLERELELVEWRARWLEDPQAAREVEARREEIHGQTAATRGDAMVAVRMNLIGLEELVPGQVWKGTAAEIDRVATELAAGHQVTQASRASQTSAGAPEVTLLTVDGRTFEIYVRPDEPTGHPSAAGSPRATHELATELEMVPGSALRGTPPGAPDAPPHAIEQLRRAAMDAMPRLAAAADVEAIVPLDGNRFTVTLRDGALTIIDVSIVRIEDHDVARLLPNSSRETSIGARTAHGEHVIQLSSHLPVTEVERALASAVARVVAVHEHAQGDAYGDGPRDHTRPAHGALRRYDRAAGRAARPRRRARAPRGRDGGAPRDPRGRRPPRRGRRRSRGARAPHPARGAALRRRARGAGARRSRRRPRGARRGPRGRPPRPRGRPDARAPARQRSARDVRPRARPPHEPRRPRPLRRRRGAVAVAREPAHADPAARRERPARPREARARRRRADRWRRRSRRPAPVDPAGRSARSLAGGWQRGHRADRPAARRALQGAVRRRPPGRGPEGARPPRGDPVLGGQPRGDGAVDRWGRRAAVGRWRAAPRHHAVGRLGRPHDRGRRHADVRDRVRPGGRPGHPAHEHGRRGDDAGDPARCDHQRRQGRAGGARRGADRTDPAARDPAASRHRGRGRRGAGGAASRRARRGAMRA